MAACEESGIIPSDGASPDAGFATDPDPAALPELETVEESAGDEEDLAASSVDSGKEGDEAGEGHRSVLDVAMGSPLLAEPARLRRRKLWAKGAGTSGAVEGPGMHRVARLSKASNLSGSSDESDQESGVTTDKHHQPSFLPSRARDSEQEGEIDEEGRSGSVDNVSGGPEPAFELQTADADGSIDGVDVEDEKEEQDEVVPIISWPTGWAIQVLSFQIRLLGHTIVLASWAFHWAYSFLAERVQKTLEAKDKATEAVSQKLTMLSQVPPRVTEGGSIMVKRMSWGCLGAAYACIFLSVLVFPAFFFEYVFVSKFVEEPVYVRESLQFDYTQPSPSAVIHLHPPKTLGGRLVQPQSKVQNLRPIPVSHRIRVTVMLTLPESDYNRQLGIFQLAVELLSRNGELIERSSQPCMLRFQSTPIRLAKTLFVGLPVLVGMTGEAQMIAVHLMDHQEQLVPTSSLRVLLQPKASSPGGLPEIYTAEILIESELPWLKSLVRNWKWTFYVWSGLMLYIVEIMMVICCCRNALVPTTWSSMSETEARRGQESKTHVARQDRTSRRSKRRVHFERSLPTAEAVQVEPGFGTGTEAEASRAEDDKDRAGSEDI